jgi:uncharacterized protein
MRIASAIAAGLLALCLGVASAAAAFDFPPLSGRVVDQAGILNADVKNDLTEKSKDLEEKSGIQLVVATVPSLQGGDIETYANELFRTWQLGQAQKNNGVLLLVAPNEHKVRIEVGYGLEGTLTDAVSSVIISSAILPRFKAGDFSGGVDRGVGGILDVLNGDSADWQPQSSVREEENHSAFWDFFPVFLCVGLIIAVQLIAFGIRWLYLGLRYGDWNAPMNGHYVKRHGRMVFVPASGMSGSSSWSSSSSSSDSSSSSSSSSDFSGGGGSSGGGGASGSW